MAVSRRNAVLVLLFALAAVLITSLLLKRQTPSPIAADHPRLSPGVSMRDITFFSQALHREMQYRVFLAEDASRLRLPVVYLLHGGGGGFRDWSNYSDVPQFASRGLLLVMPEAGYSYYTNAALRAQDRYEDYIVNDLTDDVARRFRVRNERNGRALVGVSMGGYGAIKLALHHPDLFAFAGALSPAIDVPRRRFTLQRLDQSRNFREIFGPDDSDSRRNNDPFVLVRSAEPAKAAYFYLTCGDREGLLAPNREFGALLERRHLAHDFHAVPGGHDWNQWNSQLPRLFDSLVRHLAVERFVAQ